jgi:Arc/MetJ family transcription regulator
MSRSFGTVALAMRQYVGASDVEPMAVILEVLDRACTSDPTGAMTLFAMALVVGPRLLVSLRDARESLTGDQEVTTLLENAAQVTVAQLLLIASVTRNQGNIDDPAWQATARGLTTTVEKAGNAESFGLSR